MEVYLVGGAVRDRLLGLPGARARLGGRGRAARGARASGLSARRQGIPRVSASGHAGGIRARPARAQSGAGLSRLHHASSRPTSRWRKTSSGATSRSTPSPRTRTAAHRPVQRSGATCRRACCGMCPTRSSKTPCACCVWRGLPRASPPLGFTVAEETRALMKRIVADGEVDGARAGTSVEGNGARARPSRGRTCYFETLRDCGALAVVFPELDGAVRRAAAGAVASGDRHGCARDDGAAPRSTAQRRR